MWLDWIITSQRKWFSFLPHVIFLVGCLALYFTHDSYDPTSNEKKMVLRKLEAISQKDAEAPSLVWLMTFPNSGTTYTTRLVQEISGTATANNYGTVVMNSKNQFTTEGFVSQHVFKERPNGPFILPAFPMPLPKKYLLTKTHCEGFCTDCSPKVFMRSFHHFLKGCHTGSKFSSLKPGTPQEIVTYDWRMIKKSVHLIRSPFDNMVARFRHEMNLNAKKVDLKNKKFDIKGFRNWCREQDSKYHEANKLWWMKDKMLLDLSKDVLCHTDIFKYVQWHNNAFKAIKEKFILPTLVIHYEDYHYDFSGNLEKLVNFLELDNKYEPLPFYWHEYPGFFTHIERLRTQKFIEHFASPETRSHLVRYFLKENVTAAA